MWLGGTFSALPKGGKLIRRRDVQARIGPVLEASELRRLTAGMTGADAARTVARLSEQAVRALSRGEVLDIRTLEPANARAAVEEEKPTLAPVFRELETRFRAGSVDQPISYYFSLGDERYGLALGFSTGARRDLAAALEILGDIASTIRPLLRRLRDAQQVRLFRRAVDSSNDLVIITDAARLDEPGPVIEYVNPAVLAQQGGLLGDERPTNHIGEFHNSL